MICVELIDTLWNVNGIFSIASPTKYSELIDTLWNVNDDKRGGTDVHDNELIDTLWNVNRLRYCY